MEVVQTMMLSFKFGRNCVVQSLLIINPTSSPSRRHLGRNHCLALLVIAVLPPPPPSSRRAAVDEHASRVAQPAAACCVVAARSGWWPAGAAHFLHLHFMALQCYFLILVLDGRKTSSRRTLIGVRLLGPEIEMNQIWQIRPFMDHNHDILLDGRAYAKFRLVADPAFVWIYMDAKVCYVFFFKSSRVVPIATVILLSRLEGPLWKSWILEVCATSAQVA
ncbi:uncharacterized protein [Lolium perenne]|uniref:uncharacterized protein isoform X1 n=1 Tax=Lolium perenne TaxID=4522 RepID=UPI003A9A2016